MTTFTIEYAYDHRADERNTHRPEHRAYLASLAEQGRMLAYGRYDDDAPAGALLVCEAQSVAEVEAMIAADPYVTLGLVVDHRIRIWPAVWGPGLRERIAD
ncbi:YciI family protein [Demequina sp.]|uniref:YciI family protein n=1 Tax=Demequina sp. TaxID=2050685 RepID=UPI003A8B0024